MVPLKELAIAKFDESVMWSQVPQNPAHWREHAGKKNHRNEFLEQ